jgi:hypothetical protein
VGARRAGRLWYRRALALLHGLGDLPAGPWWALGLALAPVGAVAAVRRRGSASSDNDCCRWTPRWDRSRPARWSRVVGLDVLLLGLPTLVQLAQGGPLSWTGVAVQAAVAVIGARAYLSGTTEADRVELSGR